MNHPAVKLDTTRLLGFRLHGACAVRDKGRKGTSGEHEITVKLGSKIGGKPGVKF